MSIVPLLCIGLGAGALLLMMKGGSLATMAKNMTFKVKLSGKPKLYAGGLINVVKSVFGGSGSVLRFPISIEFANRSSEQVKVTVNALFVNYKGSRLASNDVNQSSVTIQPHAVSSMDGLSLDVELSSLISVVGDIVSTWVNKGDFSQLTKEMSVDLSAVLNDTFAVNLSCDFDKEKTVSTEGTAVSGLGLVAAKDRKVRSMSEYVSFIPPKEELKHRDLIVKANGSVRDTATIMHQIVDLYASDTAELARRLRKDTLEATLQNIFDFVYAYIKYVPDSRVREQVRRPLRTLWEQKGDCDCYATLIGSILTNLNIPFKFRVAAFTSGRYQHVYVVVPTETGYHVVDPVLDACFAEKTPTKYFDV